VRGSGGGGGRARRRGGSPASAMRDLSGERGGKDEERAGKLLALDEAVVAAMKALKERGFDSPYLRPFVVARINPLRFVKSEKGSRPDFDATLEKMLASAEKFKASSVKPEHLARAGGATDE